VNIARLNHILIPETAGKRQLARRSTIGKLAGPLFWLFTTATPQGRGALLGWFLVGGLGLEVGSTHIYLVWCVMTALLIGALVARRWFALDGVSIQLEVPKRVTVGEPVRFAIRLIHAGGRPHHDVEVEGPYLPWDGRWQGGPGLLRELAPGCDVQVQLAAAFQARGAHHLEAFGASILLPVGLFRGRPIWTEAPKFLVVPRLARIARLETPTVRRYQPGGIALASKTGESMEILGVRPYRPGDPVRDLHARTWARIGAPAVREYQEEYFTRLGVVVDSEVGSEPRQLEAALSLAAGVVAHLGRGEALIDLLVVGDSVHTLTLGRSLGFLDQALDLLACVSAGPKLEPGELARRLSPHLPRLSCIVFIALKWDRARMEFADRVRSFGVGCRTLVVEPPVKKGRRRDTTALRTEGFKDLVRVPTESVERGEALVL
jgi:uncharacterized protein (DUF58 family)